MSEGEYIPRQDVAEYIRDLSLELAQMARRAGLASVAGSLEEAHRAAEEDLRALQSPDGNAAPEEAA